MRLVIRRTIIVILSLLCVISCNRNEMDTVRKAPDVYYDILAAYKSKLRVAEISKSSDFTLISFVDGSSIKVSNDDLFIYNCTETEPQTLVVKDGIWHIGSKNTGIQETQESDLSRCIPVYAYYNSFQLNIHLNNASVLEFVYQVDTDRPLTSFVFSKTDNPQLQKDINCIINGNKVVCAVPAYVNEKNLIPSFIFLGEALYVDGKKQISSVDAHDFSVPVKYTAKLADGRTRDYLVTVEKVGTLPTIFLTTEGAAPIKDKENYVSGYMKVEDPDCMYSDVSHFEAPVQLRGRGNTSWSMPKKPYKIKMDEKNPIFGIHKDKQWALIANYSDKTLLRNIVAMEISRILGFSWTPEMRSCNLYLNGNFDGVYALSEHKEVSKHKVDINPVTPEDNEGEALTGDYYIEIDGSQDEVCSFWTSVGIPIMVDDPENPTKEQQKYVKQLFKDFETALYADNFKDPENGYRKYIDVDSFINFYIVQELSKNVDGNLRKSTFIAKHRGGKMEMYHVWDFDIAFGNCNYFNTTWAGTTNTYEGWFVKDYINSGKSDGWYGRMFKDPAFVQQVKDKWNSVIGELRQIPNYIDYNVTLLGGAQDMNFIRWDILRKLVWPNVAILYTYDAEVEYLKKFYSDRLEWLDKGINGL